MAEKPTYRFAAEWEEQDAVLIAWPHANTDWAPMLADVEQVYLELSRQIARFEKLLIVTPEAERVKMKLNATQIDSSAVVFIDADTDDTWIRDFGPLTVYDKQQAVLLNFTFNGWGGKFTAEKDNRVNDQVFCSNSVISKRSETIDLVLEGGSVETDGLGSLLTTSTCLLNNNRNPHLSKKQLEGILSDSLGIDHFLWLDHGFLAGDDTDSHIDTLARLCPHDTILYVSCNQKDDEHYDALERMKKQLAGLKTKSGRHFRLRPLPLPAAQVVDGERLPATYANYLLINNAVLVPIYQDPADAVALRTIGQTFPGREVVPIDCRALIQQHGSLHCITMQLPKGTLT